MPILQHNLELERCPHCNVHTPHLVMQNNFITNNHADTNERTWVIYMCMTCGGVVVAAGSAFNMSAKEIYPRPRYIDEAIPERPSQYLKQAINSIHAPAGAVMLAASSVDAMLKEKGLTEGSLYQRIEQAANEHLITQEMARWAHDVRLDANDQRHADEGAELPNEGDASRVIEFADALAQFLFVLPARVQRGLNA